MRTLLLADDNVTVQRVIALTFAKEPVRVVTASDGHQAMDRLVVERPDIVLAGTTLPQVNGYELARFVRSKAELKNVPVLLLSGAFETVDEAQLKSSGAAGVIEKPVEPTTVISRVKELLGLKSGDQPAVAPESRPASAPRTPPREPPSAPAEPPAAVDPLQAAYDSLDDQMAGRTPAEPRRPAPRDPRSPGRPPAPEQTAGAGNPVYEVDEEWFADGAPQQTPRVAEVPPQAAPAGETPVYEVDDEWFAEDQKVREAREMEQKQLAAEMGIHEVELPEGRVQQVQRVERVQQVQQVQQVERVQQVPAPVTPVPPVAPAAPATPAAPAEGFEPIARSLPIDWFANSGSRQYVPRPVVVERPADPAPVDVERAQPKPAADRGRPMTSATPGRVADDFAQLLAFEQGENTKPPMIEPVIHAVTPEITPEMLETIAASVAGRLRDSVKVEAKAPEITGEMIKTIAYLVATDIRGSIRVEPRAPEITNEMLGRIAEDVAGRLTDRIKVEPAVPEITQSMLDQIAASVALRLSDTVEGSVAGSVHVIVAALKGSMDEAIKASAVPPQITDEMLTDIATRVAGHIQGSFSMESLKDPITEAIRETVRSIVADTSERLVREEIERIKSSMK